MTVPRSLARAYYAGEIVDQTGRVLDIVDELAEQEYGPSPPKREPDASQEYHQAYAYRPLNPEPGTPIGKQVL